MNKKHFYAAIILLSFLAACTQPALAIDIPDNVSVGTWDIQTRTYTLTSNVTEGLVITEDNLTLDGAGRTVSGVASGTGVELNGRTNVTINNLTITGCGVGIDLLHSGKINVTNNSVTNCQWGIRLIGAGTCTIEGNIVSDSSNTGIFLGKAYFDGVLRISVNNDLYNNTIKDNGFGIGISGITLSNPLHTNRIFNNSFINNTIKHAEVAESQPGANVFSGNYWDDWIPGSGPYPIDFGEQDDNPLADETPPVISCPGDTTIVGPDSVPKEDERIQTFLGGASATDDYDPDPTITNDAPDIFLLGDTIVTFTATDASGNSSTCQSTVRVVNTEEDLRIIPPIVNREGRLRRILAVVRFPKGTNVEDIDINQILVLYPGDSPDGIEAASQRIVTRGRTETLRVSIFATFSKYEVAAGVPEDGPAEIMVIGRFMNGQYFYGLDNVRLISWRW